ncbi:MAG: hypothetical protein HOP02_13615 [Methylococcaceae bacterium]|nr:hypothetical protein [Methylococcaceae bacterium]
MYHRLKYLRGGAKLFARLILMPLSCIGLLLIPIAAEANGTQPYRFEITNTNQNSNNSQCVTNISMLGIHTASIAHVLLDDEIVWDASDIANTTKTITFQENQLSFSGSPCISSSIHTVKAVFENGLITSQTIELYDDGLNVEQKKTPKIFGGWAVRRTLIWMAEIITSPEAIAYIENNVSYTAGLTVRAYGPFLSQTLTRLAQRGEQVLRDAVYDQVRGGLIGLGVTSQRAHEIALFLENVSSWII